MIATKVRIGTVADQDRFRREDMLAMTPEARIMTLIRLRNSQFGAVSRPIRDSGIVSYRTFEWHVVSRSPAI
ncbi:MAG TPA: hypothetical protein DCS43_07645 [Verrucomicrobia bacterium]|nr:hypothetical protein [Verrucomicrobiota bacterium]